jgi:hypothetical protein
VPDPIFAAALRATGCHYAFGYVAKDNRYPVPMHPLPRIQSQSEMVLFSTLPDRNTGKANAVCALVRLK